MKKQLLFGIIFVLSTLNAHAQDVIFRSSSDSILAQVLTIGTSELTYRKWNNLEGPIYTISIDDVAAIRFANGSYEFFTNKKEPVTQETHNSQSIPMLTRSGNTYYFENKVMKKREMLEWLQTQNCQAAYEQFRSGYRTSRAGWALMGIGLSLDFIGTIILATTKDRASYALIGGIGVALELACIPTIAVGYSKMHETVYVYNVSCGARAEIKPYWSIQASSNGLGIAYNF